MDCRTTWKLLSERHSRGDGRATEERSHPQFASFFFFFLVLTGLHLNCRGRKPRITGHKGGFRNGRTGRAEAAEAGAATWEEQEEEQVVNLGPNKAEPTSMKGRLGAPSTRRRGESEVLTEFRDRRCRCSRGVRSLPRRHLFLSSPTGEAVCFRLIRPPAVAAGRPSVGVPSQRWS